MLKPNFFIIGAPKAATSALRQYLTEHPSIYMAGPEEPNFYSTDLRNQQNISTEDEYLDKYFSGAKGKYIAVGEKSTWYLYSENAIKNINKSYPSAKYIVILRNPVEMVCSLHSELIFTGQEDIVDFREAWNAQADRKMGQKLPDTLTIDKKMLYYGDVCKLGEQVKKVLAYIPRNRVMMIMYDDFSNDALSVYNDVLSFLGVPDDGRKDFSKVNQNKVVRSQLLDRLFTPNQLFIDVAKRIKKKLGLKSLLIGNLLLRVKYRLNTKSVQRNPISPDVNNELVDYFRDDVYLMSEILNRNLEHWLNSK